MGIVIQCSYFITMGAKHLKAEAVAAQLQFIIHLFQFVRYTMDYSSVICLQEFEEQKFINLNDSPFMNNNRYPPSSPKQNHIDHPQSHQPNSPEPLTPVSKSSKSRRRCAEEDKNVNRGHWSTDENKKYHWFLQIHYKHFVNRHMRRMDKIFKSMENFIGTRQAEQCRSHHQKMEKKYHHFSIIISNLRNQHYSTTDVEPLAEEIQNNGFPLIQDLPTIAMLTEQSLNVGPCEFKQRRKSCNSKCEQMESDVLVHHPHSEQQFKQCHCQPQVLYNSMNMLQESHMNIGELMLYHQKEDNSGLFNFN